jgi:hypothetical protein
METCYYLFFMSLNLATIVGCLLLQIYWSSDYNQNMCIKMRIPLK